MARATIRSGISLQKASDGSGVNWRTPKPSFAVTVTGNVGPTPGSVLIDTNGTDINLDQLTAFGGLCEITHLGNDSTNFVTIGIWDGTQFYPMDEILAGETFVRRLSRFFSGEITSGTGTANLDVNWLRMYAWAAPVNVFIGAFDP